ncbi:MAG TPA: hypothetical protein PLZ95_05655 [Bryobacteraceae bacterium]|nr:hypothetical protein [Bryobacteraceae bacterium]
MQVPDVFLGMGEAAFAELLKRISISRLRTYQIYEHVKLRTRLNKLNTEHLRHAAPRLWARLSEHDADLATDLAQAILVSNLDMIIAALDALGVEHQDGFFSKDADLSAQLSGDWQQRTYDALKAKYPPVVLEFYLNHLGVESGHAAELFNPA